MRVNKRILAIILAVITCLSVLACGEQPAPKHHCTSICLTCGKCKNEACSDEACAAKCDCKEEIKVVDKTVEYESIDETFVSAAATDYKIVVPSDASSIVYAAAREINLFYSEAAGTEFAVTTDDSVEWSDDAKFISLGKTTIAEAAGFAVPSTLNISGYAVKTIGKSVFVCGRRDNSTLFGVYEFMKRTIGFEVFAYDEVSIVKSAEMKTPKFDFADEADIEYRASNTGYLNDTNNRISSRLRFDSVSAMYPTDGRYVGPYHNSLDYLPLSDPEVNAKKDIWFGPGQENLCYTAHGNPDEFEAMTTKVAKKMITLFDQFPNGTHIYFTHQDNNLYCSCDACNADNDKYGTRSASVIKFTNAVIEKVEKWKATSELHKNRDITYLIFAYTFTIKPPVKQENDKWVAADATVQPHEKLGVVYAPILSDFIHDKYHNNNADILEIQRQWKALCDGKLCLWYYSAYFWNYLVPYNNFDSVQGNYKAAKETGAMWMYDQSAYDQRQGTGFIRFKGYLQSNLLWNVNADVNELTDKFFSAYYKQAATDMRKYYDALRIHYAYLAEYCGVGGWIGNRIENAAYFPANTLFEWMRHIDDAYKAIAPLKESETALYNQLYDRICLESLAPRYLIISLYGDQVYSSGEFSAKKLSFRDDCSRLGVNQLSEGTPITKLWATWGV